MTKTVITDDQKLVLKDFLEENPGSELVNAYLCFIEKKFNIQPVLFVPDKTIYQSQDEILEKLERENRVWREAEIKIEFGTPSVNEDTRKIYICPFTGKVFGDNTHPNPQDAIYDWVSKCPENNERVGGLRVKRFYVSDDPDVIKQYLAKNQPTRDPISKVVYSSALSGKLFNSKQAVIQDFKRNYLKPIPMLDVPSQNRFEIETEFLNFIQAQLEEDRITSFVEALAEDETFTSYLEKWVESLD